MIWHPLRNITIFNQLPDHIRVVEKGGKKVQSMLQKSDVENSVQCMRPECVICKSGGKGPCSKEGVCYKVTCLKCLELGKKTTMYGETGRDARIRCAEHSKALENKKKSNLWEHSLAVHSGEEIEYRFDVMSVHSGDPLGCQLSEAINIQRGAGELDFSMNDKGELVRPAVLEIEVRRM